MGDINLLPEDLRGKEDKILQDRDVFSSDKIEYTQAEKLQKDDIILNNQKTSQFFNNNKSQVNTKTDSVLTQEQKHNQSVIEKKIIMNENIVDKKTKATSKTGSKTSLASILNKIELALKPKQDKKKKDGINLIQDDLRVPSGRALFFIFLYPFLISLGIVLGIYFALKVYDLQIQKNIQNLDKQATETISSAGNYNGLITELEDWQTKTRRIKELLTKHIYWTEFFSKLEDNTLENVRFSSFSGNIQGNLTFLASAPNYETVVRQWMHLKRADKFVKNVIISGATLSTNKDNASGVSFSVTLDLVDNIFYKTE